MKWITDDRNGICNIECTLIEAFILLQAMEKYANNKEIPEANREAMKQMLNTEPIFR